jgi:hypothetical protein
LCGTVSPPPTTPPYMPPSTCPSHSSVVFSDESWLLNVCRLGRRCSTCAAPRECYHMMQFRAMEQAHAHGSREWTRAKPVLQKPQIRKFYKAECTFTTKIIVSSKMTPSASRCCEERETPATDDQ